MSLIFSNTRFVRGIITQLSRPSPFWPQDLRNVLAQASGTLFFRCCISALQISTIRGKRERQEDKKYTIHLLFRCVFLLLTVCYRQGKFTKCNSLSSMIFKYLVKYGLHNSESAKYSIIYTYLLINRRTNYSILCTFFKIFRMQTKFLIWLQFSKIIC